LRATDMETGLLLNFGDQPQFRRIFLDNEHKKLRGKPMERMVTNPKMKSVKSV